MKELDTIQGMDEELNRNSFKELDTALGRALIDRGRVWRNCQLESAEDNQFRLNLADWGDPSLGLSEEELIEEEFAAEPEVAALAPDDGEEGIAEPAVAAEVPDEGAEDNAEPADNSHKLLEKMVVYGFAEQSIDNPDNFNERQLTALLAGLNGDLKRHDRKCRVPTAYLGQFTVTAVGDTTITITPMLPINAEAAAATHWVLYEIMPIDSHKPFKDLDQTHLQALISAEGTTLNEEDYQDLINEYIRDGKEGDPRQDPPQRLWSEVRFLQNHSIEVDAGGEPLPGIDTLSFDPLGRAQPTFLRRGGEGGNAGRVRFATGATVLFDSVTAKELIDNQICEETGTIFIRQLRDYSSMYHSIYDRMAELADQAKVLRLDTKAIQKSVQMASVQITFREKEITQLKEDLDKFLYEGVELAKYHEALTQQITQLRKRLVHLYQQNYILANQLGEIQLRLKSEIDERTGQVTPTGALSVR
ncbi:MAG TPA: hypothetical protein EYN18_06435 [Nitrospirales bacterium]|nr:hypothetical protein [Nitrospirales bacterium]